jgi:hypothetical protein
MGWTNSHLHGFRLPQGDQRGRQRLLPTESAEERATCLGDLLCRPKDWCVYDYDLGDDWEHKLLLKKVFPRSASVSYSMVLAGRRPNNPSTCCERRA